MIINPPCKKFIIFSGGGGVIYRSMDIALPSGKTIIEIEKPKFKEQNVDIPQIEQQAVEQTYLPDDINRNFT